MESGDDSVLGYELEYFDPIPNVVKTLWMKYRSEDGTTELREGEKIFLKRIKCEDIRLEDLYVGNTISIYGKLMSVKNYCNSFTRKFMKHREIHILCRIVHHQLDTIVKVLKVARNYRLRMGRVKMVPSDDTSINFIAMELVGLSGLSNLEFLGDSELLSLDKIQVEVVDSEALARLWEGKVKIPCPQHSSLCLLKPHILRAQQIDAVIEDILKAGFRVEGVLSIHFSPPMAMEVFEGYKDAIPKFADLIGHMVSAPSLALLITGFEGDTVRKFRELCGPYVPEVAKTLRPNTLRAKYGRDPTQNAVHCSDIEEHGEIECRYIFDTIANLD